MIRNIWKKYNISTIMILPIFKDITKNIKNKTGAIQFPFIQLCLEYGLINTYLYKRGKFDNKLYLRFKKEEFIKNKKLTNSKYTSLCELIIDCNYYANLEMVNDDIIIGLHIPVEYLPDINLIIEGKYSKVSDQYKQEININQANVPVSYNPEIIYIMTMNLAYGISMKSNIIKKDLEKEFKVIITNKEELFEKFNKEKEDFK